MRSVSFELLAATLALHQAHAVVEHVPAHVRLGREVALQLVVELRPDARHRVQHRRLHLGQLGQQLVGAGQIATLPPTAIITLSSTWPPNTCAHGRNAIERASGAVVAPFGARRARCSRGCGA